MLLLVLFYIKAFPYIFFVFVTSELLALTFDHSAISAVYWIAIVYMNTFNVVLYT